MPSRGKSWLLAVVALLELSALFGCRLPGTLLKGRPVSPAGEVRRSAPGDVAWNATGGIHHKRPLATGQAPARESEVRLANAEEPLAERNPGDNLFADQGELNLSSYVAEVRSRNPTIQAALAAASAAAERYPQAVALDDPMFQSMLAPESLSRSSNVQSSFYAGLAQRVPWHGKRALRGAQAEADASAASFDSLTAELRVVEAAQLAFAAYYLVFREQELNGANREKLQEFRATAKAKYEANQTPQQDMLQADVELAKLERRQIDLEQMNSASLARLNALLHRAPDAPLPPPPKTLPDDRDLPDAAQLREQALAARPELSALAARVESERAAVALACKEFYPDFEFMGRYDQFWTDQEQRVQLGMNMNLPVNKARRRAAVREAMFRVSKLQAEYEQEVASIQQDVQTAHARVEAGRQTLALFADKLLPAAENNVSAAVAGYEASKLDFLRLVDAQRQFIELQESRQAALAQYHRDLAELERAVGGELPVVSDPN